MSALSPHVVLEFSKICDWTFQSWLNHRELFDENPRSDELMKSMGGVALGRLSVISHEYVLLQIAKLHEPTVVSGQITLGIEYVVKYGGWDQSVSTKLSELADQLAMFAKGLRTVRNKVLAHNDLAAILSGSTFGEFEKNDDVKYFQTLQEFVNVVHSQVIGGPFPFNDLVKNEIADLMTIIKS
jgi:hypothetical protein